MTGLETKLKKTKFRSDQDELKLRAAYLYYVEGRTQEQVAQHLGISRIKALRLLAATREDGTVQITINSPAGSLIKLSGMLPGATFRSTSQTGFRSALVGAQRCRFACVRSRGVKSTT